jgi:hypothetical protein
VWIIGPSTFNVWEGLNKVQFEAAEKADQQG